MLSTLRNAFSAPAAALAVGSVAALSSFNAHADSAGDATPIEVVVERLELKAQAHDYAVLNPGNIGISVLKGIDAPNRTESELADALEHGVEKRSGRQAEGYHGDNGNQPTEVNFYVPYIAPDGKFAVSTYGPYNFSDAVNIIQNWQTEMAPAYTAVSFE